MGCYTNIPNVEVPFVRSYSIVFPLDIIMEMPMLANWYYLNLILQGLLFNSGSFEICKGIATISKF